MRLDPAFLAQQAAVLGVPEAGLAAVIDVESDGQGFSNGLVTIRWEGHYFWRLLPDDLRAVAQSRGLAHPRWGTIKNPRSMAARHKMLERAMDIDRTAALKSISMGLGQIMGANFAVCGYGSVDAMWADSQTIEGQVRAMVGFIKGENLARFIRTHNWAAFARRYNGPGYKKNQYDTKLHQAYLRHGGEVVPDKHAGNLCLGHKDAKAVRALQSSLRDLGHRVLVDGDYGPNTEKAVKLFQVEKGLKVTGCVDEATQLALDAAEPVPDTVVGHPTTKQEMKKRSRIVSNGDAVQKVGGTAVAVSGAIPVAKEMHLIDKVEEVGMVTGTVQRAIEPIQPALDFAMANLWVLPLVVGGILLVLGHRIVQARIEDHETGKTL